MMKKGLWSRQPGFPWWKKDGAGTGSDLFERLFEESGGMTGVEAGAAKRSLNFEDVRMGLQVAGEYLKEVSERLWQTNREIEQLVEELKTRCE
jgi:hypothetical protein